MAMPGGILVAPLISTPGDPGTGGPNDPAYSLPETIRMTWTSPAGRVTEFDSSSYGNETFGYFTLPGAIGLDMPDFSAYTDTSPVLDGELFRGVRTEARNITIPVQFYGDTAASFGKLRQELFFDMQPPRRSDVPLGFLSVVRSGGSTRSIPAYYTDGLQGSLDDTAQSQRWLKAAITIRCPGPYFMGQEIVTTVSNGKAGTWLPYGVGAPGHTYQVSSNQVLGETEITNSGDVLAYPVFTITGPATSVQLTNETTGQSLKVNQVLGSDDVLVVDCTDGKKSVKFNGTNVRAKMTRTSPASIFWAMDPGLNHVNFNIPGATSATTMSISYRERFLAGW